MLFLSSFKIREIRSHLQEKALVFKEYENWKCPSRTVVSIWGSLVLSIFFHLKCCFTIWTRIQIAKANWIFYFFIRQKSSHKKQVYFLRILISIHPRNEALQYTVWHHCTNTNTYYWLQQISDWKCSLKLTLGIHLDKLPFVQMYLAFSSRRKSLQTNYGRRKYGMLYLIEVNGTYIFVDKTSSTVLFSNF